MSVSSFLFGRDVPSEFQRFETLDPGQQQVLSQLTGGLGGGIQNLLQMLTGLTSGEPGATQAFEAPAMRQFQEQIIPQLAERFTGAGAGAQDSSAFRQQLGAAGAGLAENLQALRSQLGLQAGGQLSGLLGQALGTPTSQGFFTPGTRQPGFLEGIAPGIGRGLGALIPGGVGKLGGILRGLGGS